MEIFEALNTKKDLSLALGFFDGVHKAHQKLISVTVELARKNNLKSAVITFKNNPLCDLRGIKATYLYTNTEKCELIKELGIDYIYLLDFKKFADLSAEEYLRDVLYKYFEPKFITTGFNHNFGKNKSGDHIFLKNNQKKYGYIYNEIPPIKERGKLISTTNIKKLLEDGNIELANEFLGRRFKIKNIVERGQGIGAKIGFPTVNLSWPKDIYKIPYGVYRGTCLEKPAIINWGIRPTIGGNKEILEAHILNFNKNVYGETVEIYFDKKIRDEKRFNSIDELKNQIQIDFKSIS